MLDISLLIAALLAQADTRHPEDACLRTIVQVGATIWAAGDEGTLLSSRDAGKTWEKQPLGVMGSLLSLYFQDERRGWLVGREETPSGPSGILFFTRDGGITWNRALPGMLPPLHGVLFDPTPGSQLGFLWGESSPLQPSGLFQSTDGGKSWQPVSKGSGTPVGLGWRTGRWEPVSTPDEPKKDKSSGRLTLVGLDGSLGEWVEGNLRKVDLDLRGASAGVMAMAGKSAFGTHGLHLIRGANGWQAGKLPLTREAARQCQWRAATEKNGRTLVVGNPGTTILAGTTKSGGQTRAELSTAHTGQRLPLHSVCMDNEGVCYCAGELGRILRSADFGATWEVCRGAGHELAISEWVAGEGAHAWATLGKLGVVDGWRVSSTRMLTPEVNTPASHGKYLQAARQGGAAWVESWDEAPPADLDRLGDVAVVHEQLTRLLPELEASLVLALRVQRPRLIVVPGNQVGGQNGLEQAISRLVLDGTRLAADPKAYPEQITELGLEPWTVSRVMARVAPRPDVSARIDTQELHDILEDSLEDWTSQAKLLVQPGFTWESAEPVECWNQVHPAGMAGKKLPHLMDGLEASSQGMRRPQTIADAPDGETLKTLRLRNQIRSLALAPASPINDPQKLEAALLPTLEKLPDHQAASLLARLAANQSRQGAWLQARELHRLLVNRYPASSLVPSSCRWLIAFGSSGEARRRFELSQRVERGILQVGQAVTFNATVREGGKSPKPNAEFADKFERETSFLNDRTQSRQWLEECITLSAVLAAHGAQIAEDPMIQFGLQSAKRHLGRVAEARDFNKTLLGANALENTSAPAGDLEGESRAYHRRLANALPAESPWRTAAALELWLSQRQGECPRPLMACRKATSRPFLDGKLDDPQWQGSFRSLRGGKAEEQAQFAFAYDSEFLYLAAICPSPDSVAVEPLATRTRDSASPKRDRIGWYLDIDRDYSTGYRLVVDQAGGVSDACWLDQGWDPRWFVKVGKGEGSWTVEAAIPLALLCSSPPTTNQAWLMQCSRARPGKALQGWVGIPDPPEKNPRPESQGALLFLAETPSRDKP